jgi:hypothetical protein
MARSFIPKMAIPSSLPHGSQGAIMFKRCAAGQRIFPSEMAAHSIAPASNDDFGFDIGGP